MNNPIELQPAAGVRITTLMDNTSDILLASNDRVQPPMLKSDTLASEPLIAEHGYAALIELDTSDATHRLLLDSGLSRDGVTHNLERLGLGLDDLNTIVLSHGVTDHTKGRVSLQARLPNRPVSLHAHPDAFLERKLSLPNGTEVEVPPPLRDLLEQFGVEIVEQTGPSTLLAAIC